MAKPEESIPDWIEGNVLSRVIDCRKMLYLHRFLTEAEHEKVKRRIEKWVAKNAKKEP